MIKADQRWFDIPAALLFLAALWLIGLRIQVTKWTDSLSLIQFALLLSAVIGLALGYSSFSRKAVVWMGAAFSLVTLTWMATLLMPAELSWPEKLINVGWQTRTSLGNFFRNEGIRGPTLFMVTLLFAFWWLGLLSGYRLTRTGQPWLPLGILFVTLLIVDYYPPVVRSRHIYTGIIVFFLFLLMCRLYYLQSQARWKEKRAMVDYGAGYDISRSIAVSSVLLILAAWGIPGLARMLTPGTTEQQKLVDFWEPLQDRFENMVSDLRAPRSGSVDFFHKNLSLGTEISTEEIPVFQVTASEPRARGYRYYWRGYSYDYYEEDGWTNTIEDYHELHPSDWPQELPEYASRQKIDLAFTWLYPRSRILYLPGSPLSLSRQVSWIAQEVDGGLDGVTILAQTSLYRDETLDAEVLVNAPSVFDLKGAGQQYPEWVTERYLQLPEDLPESIPALAEEITAGMANPFEQAQVITRYLRENITYADAIEPPPAGRDPIEWFLFETKSGFCNYYATAEVLMLRSLGIPARMAVGFAQGQIQDDVNVFQVQLKNAHAWPEVFFPGIGWVEFEPTASLLPPEVYYDQFPLETGDPNMPQGLNETMLERFGNERFEEYTDQGTGGLDYFPRFYRPAREWGILGAVLLLIGLVFAVQSFINSPLYDPRLSVLAENLLRSRGWQVPDWIRFLSARASLSPIGRYFSEIPWMLRLMKQEIAAGCTPGEQVQMLTEKLPQVLEPAHALLKEYELSSFSRHQASEQLARTAHAHLWRQVVLYRIKKALLR